jgi:hypothetical protein
MHLFTQVWFGGASMALQLFFLYSFNDSAKNEVKRIQLAIQGLLAVL